MAARNPAPPPPTTTISVSIRCMAPPRVNPASQQTSGHASRQARSRFNPPAQCALWAPPSSMRFYATALRQKDEAIYPSSFGIWLLSLFCAPPPANPVCGITGSLRRPGTGILPACIAAQGERPNDALLDGESRITDPIHHSGRKATAVAVPGKSAAIAVPERVAVKRCSGNDVHPLLHIGQELQATRLIRAGRDAHRLDQLGFRPPHPLSKFRLASGKLIDTPHQQTDRGDEENEMAHGFG